jgi:hypothetical protein
MKNFKTKLKQLFTTLYYLFNIIFGLLIWFIMIIPLLFHIIKLKNIINWLDKYFPLPPEDVYHDKIK